MKRTRVIMSWFDTRLWRTHQPRTLIAIVVTYIAVIASVARQPLSAETFGEQQLLQSGHWVYDALTVLYGQTGKVCMFDTPPLSVEELRFYLRDVEYEALTDDGRVLYDKVKEYFDTRTFGGVIGQVGGSSSLRGEAEATPTSEAEATPTVESEATSAPTEIASGARSGGGIAMTETAGNSIFAGANVVLHPMVMGKFNGDVDWSTATTYCNSHGYQTINTYQAGDEFTQTMSYFPIYLSFGDKLAVETQFYFGRVPGDITSEDYFTTNIPSGSSNNGFTDAKVAYASVGHAWDNWGVHFRLMKDGMSVGRSAAGSIIYNSTFLTDAVWQLGVYSRKVNYNLDLVQVDRKTFMYIHDFKVSPFKWLKLGLLEGTLIYGPFEARFFNPFMMMHGFGGSTEYVNDRPQEEQEIYDQTDFCAYMGLTGEIVPCRNLRIYFMWAQNEMQTPSELDSDEARCYPDSLGLQLGGEYTLAASGGFWTFQVEGLYTTPFCYLKQHRECSLVTSKKDVYTWIGTPFGPDCISCVLKADYKKPGEWSAGALYTFAAHGENSFGLFRQKTEFGGTVYDAFYPAVRYNLGEKGAGGYAMSYDDANDMARTYKLTGKIQYTNTLNIHGTYQFNEHFAMNAGMTGTVVFNNHNSGGFRCVNAELLLGGTWRIF